MPATVRTESGQVSGSGSDILSYKGIPFAAPPIGDLRWKPPQKAAPWVEPRVCTAFGDDPLQMQRNEGRGPQIQRGLLDAQYLDAGRRQAARHGLDLRRRLYGRFELLSDV